jgi:hypothetical protein
MLMGMGLNSDERRNVGKSQVKPTDIRFPGRFASGASPNGKTGAVAVAMGKSVVGGAIPAPLGRKSRSRHHSPS